MHSTRALNGAPEAGERVLEEAVVEARVVGDEEGSRRARGDLAGDRGERRRVAHHRVGDAGERLDLRAESAPRG